ncbi:MAG: glutathione S-transferase [Pseudomonadota bacterium]
MSGEGPEEPGASLSIEDCVNVHCPWSGEPVSPDSLTLYQGRVVGFCNPGCRDKFAAAIDHFDSQEGGPT